MYTEGFEQWIKTANKNFSAPLGDWHKASNEMLHHIVSENLEMISDNLLRLSDQLKRFAQIKKPEDYLNVIRECINEDINATIENSQKLLHSTMEHMEECAKSCGTLHESTLKATNKEREREREK